jgi:hypothetical protein
VKNVFAESTIAAVRQLANLRCEQVRQARELKPTADDCSYKNSPAVGDKSQAVVDKSQPVRFVKQTIADLLPRVSDNSQNVIKENGV